MVESSRKLCATFSIEYNLTCLNITMSHPLIMHEIKCPQNLLSEVLQDWLWDCTNRLNQILKAAISTIVLDHRDTSFRSIPVSTVNLNETISCILVMVALVRAIALTTVMLPISYPIDKHLSNLHVSYGYLFNCVHFKRRRVKHFFDCTRSRFEYTQGYHLLQS